MKNAIRRFTRLIFHQEKSYAHKIIHIFGIRIKLLRYAHAHEVESFMITKHLVSSILMSTNFLNRTNYAESRKIIDSAKAIAVSSIAGDYIQYLRDDINLTLSIASLERINADLYLFWGTQVFDNQIMLLSNAMLFDKPRFIVEDGFLRSATNVAKGKIDKFSLGVSFTIDGSCPYYDGRYCSNLEEMLNDTNYIVTEDQIARSRRCIDYIIDNKLTKYNHQPIFDPAIGRKGVKKVLVIDQSYGDMSITKGLADDNTFKAMLDSAIAENPDADIIVKTHPDTIKGHTNGYYTGLVAHDNIYTQTEPINPISLIQYVDKVYVCTTQFGFEALMCGKEVHVFGMPFYASWGITHDRQICARRTNKRTLEEIFYIAYIVYTMYVNPEKKCACEIEEAMEYLLTLREEYFKKRHI